MKERPRSGLLAIILRGSIFLLPLIALCATEYFFYQTAASSGELYVDLARRLIANGGIPPATFSGYGPSPVPFAYPILGLWLAGILDSIGITTLHDLIWVSYAVYGLAATAVYLLIVRITKHRITSAVATSLYVLAPVSMEFRTDAGGYVRSLGLLFSTLALYYGYKVFLEKTASAHQHRDLAICGILTGLAIATHPFEGLISTVSLFYFATFARPRFEAAVMLATVGLVAIAASSIWWGPLVWHGEFKAILAASGSRHTGRLYWFLTLFRASVDGYVSVLAPLAIFLSLIELARGRLFLPGWLAVVGLTLGEPFTLLVGAILTSKYLAELFSWLPKIHEPLGANGIWERFIRQVELGRFSIIVFFLIGLQFAEAFSFVSPYLNGRHRDRPNTPSVLDGYAWIKANTASQATFAVIGDLGDGFPLQTGRTDMTSFRGREWATTRPTFNDFITTINPEIGSCASIECATEALRRHFLTPDYAVVARRGFPDDNASARWLSTLKEVAPEDIVYTNSEFLVFRLKPYMAGVTNSQTAHSR